MKISIRNRLYIAALGFFFWGWLVVSLTSCSSAPPGSYGVNAFGIGATYSTPGWSAPVPVVQSAILTKPTLLVPADSPAATSPTAQAADTGVVVPVVVAPVKTPTLAVPIK